MPSAALVPNVVSLPAEGMPPFGTGFLPPKGRLGRARDRALNALVDRLWNKGLPELNQARASLELPPLDRLRAQYTTSGSTVSSPSPAPRSTSPLRYRRTSATPAPSSTPGLGRAWTPPHGDRPFVLVAMSTTFMEHLDQLQRAVTALCPLPIQGLVTTGPAVDPDQVDAPDGLTEVRSARHREVLATPTCSSPTEATAPS